MLTPTYRFVKGVPGRSYGLAIARRLGIATEVLADAEARVPDAERNLDALLAAVEERGREVRETQAQLDQRGAELESLGARLAIQEESQRAREAELKRLEKDAERAGRRQAKQYLMDARRRVEEALGAARAAGDEAAAREARRMVEEGIREQGEQLEEAGQRSLPRAQRGDGGAAEREAGGAPIEVKSRVRLPSGGTGEVLEVRADGTAVVAAGAMKIVLDASRLTALPPRDRGARKDRGTSAAAAAPSAGGPLAALGAGSAAPVELDLRGLTGDEAEQATIAAVDAAVLAEQPFLRIIHGMGTGVVRDRVRRVVSGDRRVTRFEFAPRNQGGTGVTIVEFSA
jgi:DNA mismatch repair protein MutS2